MTFEWAVVLGAIAVSCLFVVWVMRRRKAVDGSHGTSNPPTDVLAHHPRTGGPFQGGQSPAQLKVARATTPETQDSPTVTVNKPTAKQPTGEVGSFPAPSFHVPRAPADPDQTRPWSVEEGQRLLAGYRKGDSIAVLSRTCGVTGRAVVYELSRQLLEPIGRMVDPTAPKFQTAWSTGELKILDYYYSSAVSLPYIARNMQRDQFEVAFQLFANHIPRVPAGLVLSPETSGFPESQAPELSVTTCNESPIRKALQTGGSPESLQSSKPDLLVSSIFRRQDADSTPAVSAVIGRADPSNDSDDNRTWSSTELTRLLDLYADNEDLDIVDLARHFGTTSRSVIITLANLILKPQGPLENESVPKWRRAWTRQDIDDVHDLFWSGASLPTIAQAVGRDQLSVAFRLLMDRLPDVHCISEGF